MITVNGMCIYLYLFAIDTVVTFARNPWGALSSNPVHANFDRDPGSKPLHKILRYRLFACVYLINRNNKPFVDRHQYKPTGVAA